MTVLDLRRGVFIASIVLLGLGTARAQSGLADVQGVITDSTGAVVAGAQVSLINPDSGDVRRVSATSDGRYSFPTVAPGHYSISVKATFFSPKTVKGILIELGNDINQNISLNVGSQSQTVTVTGTAQTGVGNLLFATGFYLDGVTNQQTEESDPRQTSPRAPWLSSRFTPRRFPLNPVGP